MSSSKNTVDVTGLSFVDLLFALAVSEYLTVIDNRTLSAVDWWHVGVGGTLTIGSWIGFHNSRFRTTTRIEFFNRALFATLIDIALVVIYWLLPSKWIGGTNGIPRTPDAVGVAVLVGLAFLLYSAWDALSRRPSDARRHKTRRAVTYAFTAASIAIAAGVMLWSPTAPCKVIGVDVALICLLLGYRWTKDAVRARTAQASSNPD
ncbi:hypothetical protein Back2_14820 [Nocardioides baekrokdamisoli]|uniref:Integral membrane protein n=1 Tax=Nocardioides baekrokdamisoli TaxID=1804624 RepID=A0A3G9IMG2_9ACTN|nr:hypothetical protein [Nocardioides baekrokdamisoli]BBH17195.1 hypothetical protein Back2_14820 [Nocardioides baekrokdamisoli]